MTLASIVLSSTLFAAPTIASRNSAAPKYGLGAMSTIGRPQKTSAKPKGTASRRPSSAIAPKAPTSPPTPIAAVR